MFVINWTSKTVIKTYIIVSVKYVLMFGFKNFWYTNNKNVTSESIQHMKIYFLRKCKHFLEA